MSGLSAILLVLVKMVMVGLVAGQGLSPPPTTPIPGSVQGDLGTTAVINSTGAVQVYRMLPMPTMTQAPPSTPGANMTNNTSGPPPSPTPPPTPPPPPQTANFTIMVTGLNEVNSNSQLVGMTTPPLKHSWTFTNQTYQPVGGVMSNSNPSRNCLEMQTILGPLNATVEVTVCTILQNSSSPTVGAIYDGQVKVTIEIDGWPWCGCDNGQVGQYLDLTLTLQLAQGRKIAAGAQTAGQPFMYSLGEDAVAIFANMLMVDGNLVNLTAGYPKLSVSGSTGVFTIRLPKFNSNVEYDTIYGPGFTPYTPGSSNDQTSATTRLLSNAAAFFFATAVPFILAMI